MNQETDPWNPVSGVVRTVHEDKKEVRGVSSTARPLRPAGCSNNGDREKNGMEI